jgi:hypothetical protein
MMMDGDALDQYGVDGGDDEYWKQTQGLKIHSIQVWQALKWVIILINLDIIYICVQQ